MCGMSGVVTTTSAFHISLSADFLEPPWNLTTLRAGAALLTSSVHWPRSELGITTSVAFSLMGTTDGGGGGGAP